MDENARIKMISSILYVDEAIITDMLILNEEFITKNKIDYVVHSFVSEDDRERQRLFFELPIKLNKFIEIPYNIGISTTDIINTYYENKNDIKYGNLNWQEIWENKGKMQTVDLYELNGWEETSFDPQGLIVNILKILNVKKCEKIMEYGCGAGLLSTYLHDYEYYGLDYSPSLVSKHIQLLNNVVFNFSSVETIFKNKYFDYVIINSMLEYLNNIEEVKKTISEIERISKNGIYIANIRRVKHIVKKNKHKYDGEYTHLTIDSSFFENLKYTIVNSLYDSDRYDAYKILY